MSSTTTAVATSQAPSIVREYYELTKPGITQMVVLTTVTGYYLAIPGDILAFASVASNWVHAMAAVLGTVLVSSGSCVLNHVLERDNDSRMKRTSARPLPSGSITPMSAIWFGSVLTVLGLLLLATTNIITVMLAVATWIVYVGVYTPLKQRSTHAMLIGGIPGALPFAGGWTAVTGVMNAEAWALFAILFFWQLPHFLALSWMYRTDYLAGGFALNALKDESGKAIGRQMVVYSALLLVSLCIPTVLGVTGVPYTIGAAVLGLWLLVEAIRFWRLPSATLVRRVLLTAYAVLMGVLMLMVIDKA